MNNDSYFLAQMALYESSVIISDFGTSLEKMSKEHLYLIVLLDVLGYNYAGEAETSKLSSIIVGYSVAFSSDKPFKEAKKSIPLVQNAWALIIDLYDTAKDKEIAMEHLLSFALQCQGSIDVLTQIATDTNNKDLKNAASKAVEIIESSFNGTLEQLIENDMNAESADNIATAAINTIWDVVCQSYLPTKFAQLIASVTKIGLEVFCKTDVSIDAYYKLEVTAAIEQSLRDQINSFSNDFLRRENLQESARFYAVINLYCASITQGYEYVLEYLNEMGKDSSYIYESYVNNETAFKQFEEEIKSKYYSLYGY